MRLLKHLLTGFMIGVMTVLTAAGLLGIYKIYLIRSSIVAFEESYRQEKVLGKSTQQIISEYGEPFYHEKKKDGFKESFTYYGPCFMVCRIEFDEQAIADKIEVYMK